MTKPGLPWKYQVGWVLVVTAMMIALSAAMIAYQHRGRLPALRRSVSSG